MSRVRVMDGGFVEGPVLDGAGLGEAKVLNPEEAIKAKIEQEKVAEARALQNEGAAEKVLSKAVKTGSVADYNSAQTTVSNLARETALQTLKGMGYKCSGPAAAQVAKEAATAAKPAAKVGAKAEGKPEAQKPAAKAAAKAEGKPEATGKKEAAKPVAKSQPEQEHELGELKKSASEQEHELGELESQLKRVTDEVGHQKVSNAAKKPKAEGSIQQMKTQMKAIDKKLQAIPGDRVELLQEMVGYGDAGGGDSEAMLTKAKEKTDVATEKLQNMEKELSGMEGAAKSAQRKMKANAITASTNAIEMVTKNKGRMKEMKESLGSYRQIVLETTKRFAEKKTTQAQNFAMAMTERYYKSRAAVKQATRNVKEAKKHERHLTQRWVDSKKRVGTLDLDLQRVKMTAMGTEGDLLFATDKQKEFALMKVQTTQQNIEAYTSQKKLVQKTIKNYKQDITRQRESIKNRLRDVWRAKQEMMKTQENKNKAVQAVEDEKKRGEKLLNEPLPAPKTSNAQMQRAISRAAKRTEANIEKQDAERDVKKLFAKAGKTGAKKDLWKAERAETAMQTGSTGLKKPECSEQKGTCDFKPRTCRANRAKCKGSAHGKEGGPGGLQCTFKDIQCTDKITSSGIYVPIAPDVGFCAPWIPDGKNNATSAAESAASGSTLLEAAAVGGRTYVQAANPVNDKGLGKTYIVKLGGFHPDGASRSVGVLAFKRIVCDEENCEEFKASQCIRCDLDIFPSKATSQAQPKDNENFLLNCAIPMLKKNKDMVPNSAACQGEDLVFAKRALMAW